MEPSISIKKEWIYGLAISILLPIIMIYYCQFTWQVVLGVTLIENLMLLAFYKYMTKHDKPLPFQIFSICLASIALYYIKNVAYSNDISYSYWLFNLLNQSHEVSTYEAPTILLINYILMTIFVMPNTLIRQIKKRIDFWLPPTWSVIAISIIIVWYQRELNDKARLMGIMACMACLIIAALGKYVQEDYGHVSYFIDIKSYIVVFISAGILLLGISSLWNKDQLLPGATWLHSVMDKWNGGVIDIEAGIPYSIPITKEAPVSERILFEVAAKEPLYLRQIAYTHYEKNTWSIPEENASFIRFKPTYIEAEYAQTSKILDEIEWIRRQDNSTFAEYDEILKYPIQKNVENQFYIPNNPRNTNNYFTVNGTTKIVSDYELNIYYYHGLENIYFHRRNPIREMSYRVTYIDRVPKEGTREYAFLKNMNKEKWVTFYTNLERLKWFYKYPIKSNPSILETYTPLRQYENIEEDFTQIPEDIRKAIRSVTTPITDNKVSDWDKAEAIEAFLSNNPDYKYSLNTKALENNKDSIYNFLFIQKEGICQDFASSMVLMCRSIGLPTRYVTGFLATEQNEETGNYIVREKDAHAFVEVYIAGYGWMQFDPTPAISEEEVLADISESKNQVTREYAPIKIIIGIIIAGALLLISKKLSQYVIENIWAYRVLRKSPHIAIESILKRTLRKLERKGLKKGEEETLQQYAERIYAKQLDITPITHLFEVHQYGKKELSNKQIIEAFNTYKNLD